jgi:hypothetical protein
MNSVIEWVIVVTAGILYAYVIIRLGDWLEKIGLPWWTAPIITLMILEFFF